MSFLVNALLGEALRKAYHEGEMQVKIQYLIGALAIGTHRVVLKRNFNTACWVPPAGSRSSHTIYYGDLMLERVLAAFCAKHQSAMPALPGKEELLKKATKRVSSRSATEPSKVDALEILNELLLWLQDSLSDELRAQLQATMVTAVAAYGRHERQHARNTPQDLKAVNRDLKALCVPFGVFNLFEDARIEHISRKEMGEKFGWLDFEEIAPMTSPFNLFLRLINLEGEIDKLARESGDTLEHGEPVAEVALRVDEYYREAVACVHANALYPIMADFVREFAAYATPPEKEKGDEAGGSGGESGSGSGSPGESSGDGAKEGTKEGSKTGSKGGSPSGKSSSEEVQESFGADLSTAAQAAEEGDAFFAEFERDAEVIGGTDEEGKAAEARAKAALCGDKDGGKPGKGKVVGPGPAGDSVEPVASGGRAHESAFLADAPGRVDEAFQARIQAVETMLMRMFKTATLPMALDAPGRRMSPRHLARGDIRYLRPKVVGGKGKRRYSVVYDCSGSMAGHPDREGKVLLLALNRLAQRGYLQGSLILSGYVNGAPSWLHYEWPVAEEVILRISTSHGHEGLQDALADNLKHVKGMDDVFVYTDASITDAPIDRAFFAAHRVWPVGLYAGSEERVNEMERHFPQNIIRPTVEKIVEAMLTRNRRTVG